jgi:hypothetical protein
MKYIFCIIAVIIQPFFSWYVYHKQDKRQAALKMPLLYYSVAYLIVQFYVFFKFCLKIPEDYQMYSYLIQAAILAVFIILEFALFGSNRYIQDVDNREQASIRDFKGLIQELEICGVGVTDPVNQQQLRALLDKMRYSDPVSSSAVEQENNNIHELIGQLSTITEHSEFAGKCNEISKQLDIRKIKNVKERG